MAWHRDGSEEVGYSSAHILWVPFTPCNRDYPGPEFQTSTGEAIAVDLEPADVLLFSDQAAHRTAACRRTMLDCGNVRMAGAGDIFEEHRRCDAPFRPTCHRMDRSCLSASRTLIPAAYHDEAGTMLVVKSL